MKLLRSLALVAFLPSAALAAAPMETVQPVDGSGVPLGTPSNPLYVSGGGGGGGGGATGSVTPAGTNGAAAQAVQGITGGIAVNSYPAQFNSTLPTLASGTTGYLAVDANGRLILSPGGSISVSNFPASQAVTNAGTFGVQVTAALPTGTNSVGSVGINAGTNVIGRVGIDQTTPGATNATTSFGCYMPSYAALASGAYGCLSTDNVGRQIISSIAFPVGLAAGTNIVGRFGIDQTTPGTTNGVVVNSSALPTGAATAALQSSEINSATYYVETTTTLAASATFTGTARLSAASGSANPFTYFTCEIFANQAGTLYVEGSNDNSTFFPRNGSAGAALAANGTQNIRIPAMYPYNRCRFVNGATANTSFAMTQGYTRF